MGRGPIWNHLRHGQRGRILAKASEQHHCGSGFDSHARGWAARLGRGPWWNHPRHRRRRKIVDATGPQPRRTTADLDTTDTMLADGQHGWAVGQNGTILATADGGKSWQTQASNAGADLASIAILADGQRGWAVGQAGTILATADGGKS